MAVKSGLIAATLACIAWILLALKLGFRNFEVDRYRLYAEMILLFGGILFAIFLTRKKQGYLEYKAAVKSGIVSALLFGLVMCVFTFIYYKFINPGFVDYLIAEAEKTWRQQAATEEKIKQSIEVYRSAYTPFRAFMVSVFMGTLLSLVLSIFLKKKPDQRVA